MDDDSPCVIEVTGLKYAVTKRSLESALRPLIRNLVSIRYEERRGKADLEVVGRANAEAGVRTLNALRDPALCHSPPGQNRTLRASVKASVACATFINQETVQRWSSKDKTAMGAVDQARCNNNDMMSLFEKLANGGMRESLLGVVASQEAQNNRVLKELHLALGRPAEMVFAGDVGQKAQDVVRSEGGSLVEQIHLDEFAPLFAELPVEARRTGIDETLHRIARSWHAIAKKAVSVTARVGRTIQGTVLPMMVNMSAEHPLEVLAQACKNGLLIIGPPNVGKVRIRQSISGAKLLLTYRVRSLARADDGAA